jgi:hypothetical protein
MLPFGGSPCGANDYRPAPAEPWENLPKKTFLRVLGITNANRALLILPSAVN